MKQLDLIADYLRQNPSHPVKLRVRGNSMRPYLVHERDYVMLRHADKIRKGDIVLAQLSPSKYVLHRVVKISKEGLLTLRGDGNIPTEECPTTAICGIVSGFYRKGSNQQTSVTSVSYRIYKWLWMHSLPFRRMLLRLHNLFYGSCKNLNRLTPTGKEIDAFLSLVRTSLWQEPIKVSDFECVRWSAVWQLAREQTVEGMVAASIKQLHPGIQEKAKCFEDPDSIAAKFWIQHQRLNKTLIKTFKFLRDRDFYPVLLKGQGNATHYKDPLTRQCGDIDIYIGPTDYVRVCKCIGEFVGEEAILNGGESEKHLHLSLTNKCSLELHRIAEKLYIPKCDRFFQQLSQKNLHPDHVEKVIIEGQTIEVPPLQFNVLYIFNHLWHHLMLKGVGLRQLCDWCILLHDAHDNLDYLKLESDLRRLQLLRGWQILGQIAVQYLGLPKNEMPCFSSRYSKQSSFVWERILDGGNFGRHGRRVNHIDRKKHLFRQKIKALLIHTQSFCANIRISPFDAVWIYLSILKKSSKKTIRELTKFYLR